MTVASNKDTCSTPDNYAERWKCLAGSGSQQSHSPPCLRLATSRPRLSELGAAVVDGKSTASGTVLKAKPGGRSRVVYKRAFMLHVPRVDGRHGRRHRSCAMAGTAVAGGFASVVGMKT